MSILFPVKIDNTGKVLEFKSLELAEIFDPTKNPNFNQARSVHEVIGFLRAIFTHENFKAHPSFLVGYLRGCFGDKDREYYETNMSKIDETYLWALPFVQYNNTRDREGLNGLAITLCAKKYIPSQTNDIRFRETNAGSPIALTASKTEQINEVLKITGQSIEALLLDGRYVNLEYLTNTWISSTNTYLVRWFFDSKIVSYNGENIRPSSVPKGAKISVQSPETLEHGDFYGVKVKITATKENRSSLYRVLSYSTNPLDLIEWPRIAKNEHKPVLYGVELECSTDYDAKEIIDAADDPFFIAKDDSSISGTKKNRMELVTIPSSLKSLKRDYALWFRKLDYSKFDTSTKTSNGMHVHIDRKAFDDNTHIKRMSWFYNSPSNREFIVAVSERGSQEAMQTYTKFAQFMDPKRIRNFKNIIELTRNDRMTAVNIGNHKGTVEVRVFRGIVSYASIVKNLEAVDSIFWFTKEHGFTELSFKNYFKWLSDTPANKYSVLKKFLANSDIEFFKAYSEVYDILFIESDPERMVDKIKKSGLAITNHHITAMNRGRKRTFVLSELGIEIKENNKGKMAFMDRDLETRYTRGAA